MMQALDIKKYKKILIIAPHPDDDVIACSGLIYYASINNLSVDIAYITNGAGSKNFDKVDLVETRNKEAINALKALFIDDKKAFSNLNYTFLNFSSLDLKQDIGILYPFLKGIKDKYDLVLLPHYNDRHKTHFIITDFFKIKLNTKILFYEVWASVVYSKSLFFIDISDIVEYKRRAILEHHSQNKILSFADGIIAKNKYNAVFKDINEQSTSRFVELYEEYHA